MTAISEDELFAQVQKGPIYRRSVGSAFDESGRFRHPNHSQGVANSVGQLLEGISECDGRFLFRFADRDWPTTFLELLLRAAGAEAGPLVVQCEDGTVVELGGPSRSKEVAACVSS